MADDRLRASERAAKSGTHQDEINYLHQKVRSGQHNERDLWKLFEHAAIPGVLHMPWSQSAKNFLIHICEMIREMYDHTKTPSRESFQMVISNGAYNQASWEHAENVIIFGGEFNSSCFANAENVVVLGGTFTKSAFTEALDVIILGGHFSASHNLDQSSNVVIYDGQFTGETLSVSRHVTILGGNFLGKDIMASASDVVVLGGKFRNPPLSGGMDPFRNAADSMIWLPGQYLGNVELTCEKNNCVIACTGLHSLKTESYTNKKLQTYAILNELRIPAFVIGQAELIEIQVALPDAAKILEKNHTERKAALAFGVSFAENLIEHGAKFLTSHDYYNS